MEQLVVDQARLQRDVNTHGTEAQLELYALGRLAESDLASLEEHLLVCVSCREKLDGLGDFVLGIRGAAAPAAAPGRVTWAGLPMNSRLASFLGRPAVSMALAFLALLLVIAIFSNRNQLAPVSPLQLATRGPMPVTFPARSFDLKLTDAPREGGPFRVEVLNAAGATAWNNLAESTPSGVEVRINQPLGRGDYFVRLYSSSGTMLGEYEFRIR